ncbi:MAG TPA: FkbM family methyltransferase [Aliidongia sp.]|nr:FkbM family methyltransferase [Aliidongia sp.]
MSVGNVPFSIVVPTRYGQMIINRNDINQANALIKTGQSLDHAEIELLGQVLRLYDADFGKSLSILDLGANFGTFSLGLAPLVGPKGVIHAFEPQRILFNMICGSVALNGLTNVHVHNLAVGDREGAVEIPQFDYSKPLNFGSVEFSAEQREPLSQERGHDPAAAELVPLATLDRFGFERVHLLKIDVEGMELAVLDGAQATIGRCRPIIFAEFIKVDREALRLRLEGFGYSIFHTTMCYLAVPNELAGRVTIGR